MEIINWIKLHIDDILSIFGGIVAVATIVVKLTPSTKDDGVLNWIIEKLAIFGLCNPDGSFCGKKADDKTDAK
jgi:hypothetical protein